MRIFEELRGLGYEGGYDVILWAEGADHRGTFAG
jgi:hypothetical protein